ncbi:F0F1 ATP synthase subunit B [Alicyclobacillus tolerans]|uniref:F0F1 ATP synthase subunit B n=1 Tax=Alicyclobacillus tolerans TaxID=90970 RepID=UPI001F032013|nr:F0F1 ATP synthase subunit B [Alicyclobacillus tolerans]MCF8567156.1 F0F1 ATP synthase subunit B [Alicyclobacillus tolerans]
MFEFGTFVVSIVTFLIMFWIIKVYGFGPLAKMLEQRRVHIETQISEAEQNRMQAEQYIQEQRQLLEQTRQEAKEIMEAARVRAEEHARDIIRDAQAEAERLLQETRELIERERTEALNAVLDKVAGLTVELATKLLHNHVSAAVHEDMIAEAEKKLGELVC